ncbi:MAG: threonine/serine ThrE exporter family protein [Dermatophilaceae bacterium]
MRPVAARAAYVAVTACLGLTLTAAAGWSSTGADPSRAELPAVTASTTTTPAPTTTTSPPTTTSPRPTQTSAASPSTTPAQKTVTASPSPSPLTVTATVTAPVTRAERAESGSPPAVQQSGISRATAALAVATLAAAALLVWLLPRRAGPPPLAPRRSLGPERRADEGLTTMLVELGEAMVDAGYPVSEVQDVLRRVAGAGGSPDAEIIALPTALLVSLPGHPVETAASTAGLTPLRLDQVDAVSRVAEAARSGQQSPASVLAGLREATSQPPPFGPVARTAGYVLLSAGLAVILNGGMVDVLVAAALGALVGAVMLMADRLPPGWRAVLPMLCAFGVAVAVFLLRRTSLDIGILAPLVAPLVTFLPGALLTVSVLELATGQMIAGAGRLAAGALQLVLLALGITAGAQLVGVPASAVGSTGELPLGALAPWLGIAVFGVGVVMNKCARPSSMRWILLVLYVAYGAQIVGGLFFGAELSAFVGAVTMSPVAAYVARRPTGPATLVSFLPAFWLLVPGALGLVGVTMLLGEDRNGLSSLTTTAVTMVAISFGVLIGRGMSLRRPPDQAAAR